MTWEELKKEREETMARMQERHRRLNEMLYKEGKEILTEEEHNKLLDDIQDLLGI